MLTVITSLHIHREIVLQVFSKVYTARVQAMIRFNEPELADMMVQSHVNSYKNNDCVCRNITV